MSTPIAGGALVIKGHRTSFFPKPVGQAAQSQVFVDCREYNAANIEISLSGTILGALVLIQGSASDGGGRLQLPDANAAVWLDTSSASLIVDVTVGAPFITCEILSLVGTGTIQVYATPYVGVPSSIGRVSQYNATLPALQPLQLTSFQADASGLILARMAHQVRSWQAYHAPAVNTQATATRAAAGTGFANVLTGLSAALVAGAAAPAAVEGLVEVLDGASVVWARRIALPAVAGESRGFDLSGLWIQGTANQTLTARFAAAGGANTYESIAMTGTVVAA